MGFNTSVTRTKATNVKPVVLNIANKAMIGLGLRHTANAKLFAPVEFGQLRNSISTVDSSNTAYNLNNGAGERGEKLSNSGLKKGEIYSGSTSDHAIFQEYGTRYIKAQPFLRPSAELVFTGANAQTVMKKYNRQMMDRELKVRKEVLKNG
jgi:HK97 gp10 family phage protein